MFTLNKAVHDEVEAKVGTLGMEAWLKLRHGDKNALEGFAEKSLLTVGELVCYFAEEAGEGWIDRSRKPEPPPPVPEAEEPFIEVGDPSQELDDLPGHFNPPSWPLFSLMQATA